MVGTILQMSYLIESMVNEWDVDGAQGVVGLCMRHLSLRGITKWRVSLLWKTTDASRSERLSACGEHLEAARELLEDVSVPEGNKD